MMPETGNLFLVEETTEDGGMSLFFADEQLCGDGEVGGLVITLGGTADQA